jgi:integrase
MSGHVRQRGKKGQWYAIIDVFDDGKRKRRWHKLENCKGKREAEKACERLILQQTDGTYIDPSNETLAEFLERWLDHMRGQVSPRTHERYAELCRKNISPLLGGSTLPKLKPAHISAAYTKALTSGRRDGKGGLSPRTVTHMHRVLREALQQAVRWQSGLGNNPADAVKPPKVERRQLSTYDIQQTAELLESVRGNRMFMPAMLAVLCGLRRGEIAALQWRHVDLERRQIAVAQSAEQTGGAVRYKPPKSGRARTVAISEMVVTELRAHRIAQAQGLLSLGIRISDDTFVVAQADGSPLQPNSLTHEWVRQIGKTALPRIRYHDLRHAHATHLLSSGVHPKVASERLGHSKVGITLDLYSHVLPGMQEDAAARVDGALQAALQKRMVAKG